MLTTNLDRFRFINMLEGFSYLALLLFAMPMKYMYNNPAYVKDIGMAHGVLFCLFCLFLAIISNEKKLSKKESFILFIASLIPLGTFWIDKKMKDV